MAGVDAPAPGLPSWTFRRLVGLAALLRYLSTAAHEAGHWAVLALLGRGPVMGFGGLVQRWETPPPDPAGWVRITFAGSTGWLRLASPPAGTAEWVAFLAAGPAVTVALAWVGWALYRRAASPASRGLGLLLCLVNALGVLLFPFNYFLSSGDTAFIAYHLGVPEGLVALPYEALRGGALVAGLAWLGTWRERGRWAAPALLGYILVMVLLFPLDGFVRQGVAEGLPLFAPLAGWSAPVLAAHLLALGAFLLVRRGLTAAQRQGQVTTEEVIP